MHSYLHLFSQVGCYLLHHWTPSLPCQNSFICPSELLHLPIRTPSSAHQNSFIRPSEFLHPPIRIPLSAHQNSFIRPSELYHNLYLVKLLCGAVWFSFFIYMLTSKHAPLYILFLYMEYIGVCVVFAIINEISGWIGLLFFYYYLFSYVETNSNVYYYWTHDVYIMNIYSLLEPWPISRI